MIFEGYNGRIIVEGDELFVERGWSPGRYDGPRQTQRILLDDVRGGFLEPPTLQRPGYLQLSVEGEPDYELSREELLRHPGVVTFTEAQRHGFERLHDWLETGGTLPQPTRPGPDFVAAPLPPSAFAAPPQNLPPRGSAVVEPVKQKSWILRHKILTAIAAIFLLGLIGSLGGSGSKTTKQNDAVVASAGSASAAPAPVASATVDPAVAKRKAAEATEAARKQAAADAAAAKRKAAEERAAAAKAAAEQAAADKAAAASAGQQNALESARNYLSLSPFSRSGLIKQLKYEGYSTAEATYAVENAHPDYNAQAAQAAKNYLDLSSFSRSGLIKQLTYEGYTQSQAEYGVRKAGL